MKRKKKQTPNAWCEAVELTDQFLKTNERADSLWERTTGRLHDNERRRCRNLFFGVLRNVTLIEWAIKQNVRVLPRGRLRALLMVAGFELLEGRERAPQADPLVVHHAVERAKELVTAPEVRLVNAVLRRLPETLGSRMAAEARGSGGLALRYSHPEWLVSRWIGAFGWDRARELLRWNQEPAPWYLRVFGELSDDEAGILEASRWAGFYRVPGGGREIAERLMEAGRGYSQDPSTRLGPELLAPKAGESVVDLCAAPGGKSLWLAEVAGKGDAGGTLVSLDLPGGRLERLKENLSRYPRSRETRVVGMDLLEASSNALEERGLPGAYDAVLLDAPCSNTGVFRRRVDARWLLEPPKIAELAALQLRLLRVAAGLVRPEGRIVYSTCSVEAEENREVAEAFAAESRGRFVLEKATEHFPWKTGHDGGGAFLLRRRAAG